MTDYRLNLWGVPEDVPVDVLLEHIAYGVRNLRPDGSMRRVRFSIDRTPRNHPFDGPEMNDDLPRSETIFSGKAESQDYDAPIRGTLPLVPEYAEVIEVDIDDVVDKVYRAIGEDFPYLKELFDVKRREREHGSD